MPSYDDVLRQLTAPGAPFEMSIENVRGLPMRNFKNRERTMRDKVAASAGRGDLAFLVHGGETISYTDHARLVWGTAARLRDEFGAKPGDRLAILAVNRPEWVISLFGATSIGMVGVALNGWWQSDELEYGLTDSGARYLVVDERLYPRVAPVLARAPALETVFYIGETPPPGTVSAGRLIQPADAIPSEPLDEDDPFVLLYTSGTTGRSKGCITTHRGTINQVLAILFANVAGRMMDGGEMIPSDGQLVTLLSSPLFHVGGLHSAFCANMTAGARVVFYDGKFDPERVMQLIERERVTAWPAIPTMLHRVVHSPAIGEYDLSSLRAISFGGAPTAPETIDRAREVLPVEPSFANAYGLTETHGIATVNGGKALLGRKTAAGRPAPLLDVAIVSEDGQVRGPGELGEVRIYGATVTPGYWNRPDATAETVRDGWLHTGDIGYLDDEGFLFIVDRAKDMIIRGGENVYCVEIENCLADHDEIDEAAVVGVPDAELGERVKAVVRLKAGSTLTPDLVRAHVASRLAYFKVPELVELVEAPLPRNAAGKLLKNKLREKGMKT